VAQFTPRTGQHPLEDLAGPRELGAILHVTPSAVTNWAIRFEDFPAPLIEVSRVRLYSAAAVIEWCRRTSHGSPPLP
jgi:hypothetical protein